MPTYLPLHLPHIPCRRSAPAHTPVTWTFTAPHHYYPATTPHRPSHRSSGGFCTLGYLLDTDPIAIATDGRLPYYPTIRLCTDGGRTAYRTRRRRAVTFWTTPFPFCLALRHLPVTISPPRCTYHQLRCHLVPTPVVPLNALPPATHLFLFTTAYELGVGVRRLAS